jgi:hypothetical protein
MTSLYNDLLDFFFFLHSCCMHLFKSFYFLSIGSFLRGLFFFLDNMAFLFIFTRIVQEKKTHVILKILINLSFFLFIAVLSSNFEYFFGNAYGPSFHFCLHIVRKKNTNLKKYLRKESYKTNITSLKLKLSQGIIFIYL